MTEDEAREAREIGGSRPRDDGPERPVSTSEGFLNVVRIIWAHVEKLIHIHLAIAL